MSHHHIVKHDARDHIAKKQNMKVVGIGGEEQADVALTGGVAFGGGKATARLNFGCRRETLDEGLARMQATIAANVHRMQYGAVDTAAFGASGPELDAFDIAIQEAAKLALQGWRADFAPAQPRRQRMQSGRRAGAKRTKSTF